MIKVSVDSQDFMPNWNILMDGVNAGDIKNAVSILGWGRSTRDGNGNPLQFCFLENPMDRGPWQATVHRIAESWTRPSLGDLPDPGIEPTSLMSPALASGFLTTSTTRCIH